MTDPTAPAGATLRLEHVPDPRTGLTRVTARFGDRILHVDAIDPALAADRDRFALALQREYAAIDPEEIREALVQIADRKKSRGAAVAEAVGADPFGAMEGGPPEPRPIADRRLPVPPLDPALVPVPLRGWIVDVAERIGCPPEYPAAVAVVALAAVVGRRVGARPKRHDDWTVVPNLWGAIVGPPGALKTPAMAEALRPLRRLEVEARDRHREAAARSNAEILVFEARASAAKDELKKAARQKKADSDVAELALAASAEAPEPPPEPRYVTNDPTVEKLGELLRDNPDGVLVLRDELTGFFAGLEKPGREADRAFYLEAWNGDGSFTYDRIGRGTVRIEAACVSLLGGIQPGPPARMLRAAARGDEHDGLVSRLQILVMPDPGGPWVNVDRRPDKEAKDRAFAVFRALDGLDPAAIGAESDGPEEIPYLRFSPEAQDLFDGWRENLENVKLRAEHESPLIESHLAKYRSLFPSLALLFHVVDVVDGASPPGPISHRAASAAAAWCEVLEAHARRVYDLAGEGDSAPARLLAERLRRGELPGPFTARQVSQRGWSGLDSAEAAHAALARLEREGWVIGVERASALGGRPTVDYFLNPRAGG